MMSSTLISRSMKIFSFLAVIAMVIMALFADYLLKIAGSKTSILNRYFIGGMIVYSLTAFVWYFVLRNIKFSLANLFYSLFTVLISVGIGAMVFRERLGSIEILAVLMALASIVLLFRFA